jgi:hypothetical protein
MLKMKKIWQEISFFLFFSFALPLFLRIWCWIPRTPTRDDRLTVVWVNYRLVKYKAKDESIREKRELYIYVEKNNKALNFSFFFLLLCFLCKLFFSYRNMKCLTYKKLKLCEIFSSLETGKVRKPFRGIIKWWKKILKIDKI